MARHHGAAQTRQVRTEMPPAASFLAPIVIFSIALFAVYQGRLSAAPQQSALPWRWQTTGTGRELTLNTCPVGSTYDFVCVVYLAAVNHHTQLETMIATHEEQTADHHFVTGGRAQQEGRRDITLGGGSSSTQQDTSSTNSTRGLPRKVIANQDTYSGNRGTVSADDTARQGTSQSQSQTQEEECHIVEHAEYHGGVVKWGDKHITQSALECCAACRAHSGCNTWVWCAADSCGGSGANVRVHGECWLKQSTIDDIMDLKQRANAGIPWTSGALYSASDFSAWQQRQKDKERAEVDRLKALRDREDLPLVWLEVTLKGQVIGRMEFVLFTDIAPLAAENMRRMCTGEVSPQHTLKGAYFYRIIDQFIDQTGVDVEPCALGGMFKDDPKGLELKHDRKGLLSVANMGHDTNTGHFSILQAPAPHLNKNYVIFGELVSGWEVAHAVNKLSVGQPNNELLHSRDALISDVGQIRRGTPVSEEVIKAGMVKQTRR